MEELDAPTAARAENVERVLDGKGRVRTRHHTGVLQRVPEQCRIFLGVNAPCNAWWITKLTILVVRCPEFTMSVSNPHSHLQQMIQCVSPREICSGLFETIAMAVFWYLLTSSNTGASGHTCAYADQFLAILRRCSSFAKEHALLCTRHALYIAFTDIHMHTCVPARSPDPNKVKPILIQMLCVGRIWRWRHWTITMERVAHSLKTTRLRTWYPTYKHNIWEKGFKQIYRESHLL